jgi:DNA-binding GntR family transcriptional regulator
VVVAGGLSRSVLADQVKDRILEGILSGHYPPDSRIVETQIARELGTSQAPVREALRGLEALGVVEIAPFRGARVRRPSRRSVAPGSGVPHGARSSRPTPSGRPSRSSPPAWRFPG